MDKRPIESSENTLSIKCQVETPIPDETAVENDLLPATSDSIPSGFLPEDVMIPELPVEVVGNIFQFLCLRDRRNASLVCSKWHEAGNFPKYSRNEKLVFRGYQDVETLLLFLNKTQREYLNLEFHNCTFHDASNLLLISQKIWSVSFKNCILGYGFRTQLFKKCKTLREFRVHPYVENPTLDFIESLEKGFVHENLEIFHLCVIGPHFSDEVIDSLFNMFPNLKNLTFQELSRFDSFHFNYPTYSSSSLARRIISKEDTLEVLKIVGCEDHLRLLKSNNFPRLKRLTLRAQIDPILTTPDFDFIFRFEYLEKLSIQISTSANNTRPILSSSYIAQIIHRCSHLKHLKLRSMDSGLILNAEMFQALVSSKLISLKLAADVRLKFTPADCYDESLQNKTLRVLRLVGYFDVQVLSLFLHHFRNLKFLEIYSDLEREMLKSIGQLQENLTSLKFKSIRYRNVDATPFSNHQALNCLRSLTNLEALDLSLADHTLFLDCELLPSGLKYLRLSFPHRARVESEVVGNSLLPLKNKKELEAIYINSEWAHMTDVSTWLEICSSLKKLRVLCLNSDTLRPLIANNTYDPFSEIHRNLFECCPSLHCLVQKAGYKNLLFYYDQVDKKMEASDDLFASYIDDFIITEVIAGTKMKFNFISSSY